MSYSYKRNIIADIAKGIGMVCIIAGHLGIDVIAKIVFIFHVPLFFIISGYFLHTNTSMAFAKKKIRQLITPYLITGIFLCIFDLSIKSLAKLTIGYESNAIETIKRWSLAVIYGSGSRTDFFQWTIPYVGAIWFLLALLWALLIANYIGTKKYGVLLVVLLGVLGIITSRVTWLPWSIQSGLVGAIFVMIGFYANKSQVISVINNKNGLVSIISFILFCLSLLLYLLDSNMMSIVKCQFPHGVLDFISAINGTILIVMISKRISSKLKYLKSFLGYFGENSLIVLCAHTIELHTFPWDTVYALISDNAIVRIAYYPVAFIFKIIWAMACVKIVSIIKGGFINNRTSVT